MHATKRKFNSLIQGLGTPAKQPTKSTDSKPTTTYPRKSQRTANDVESLLEKRRRLGIPQSNSTASASATGGRSATTTSPSGKQVASGTDSDKPLARFCPTDRNELVKRLATYNDITDWTPKPDRVSEIEWAKRGWVCHGKETVRCVLCHKELVVKLNKKEVDGKEVSVLVSSEIAEALVDKYVELIVSSHREDCLWRKRGCEAQDTLLRLPLASATAAYESLRQRYDELCERKPFLPYEFNLRLPKGFNVDDVLTQLPSDFFQTKSADGQASPAVDRVAFQLALFGWQGLTNARMGPVPNSASCHTCLRRLGLWMFKSKEVDENGEVLVPAPMDHLDPVREHRFFCPWKNAQVQKRSNARPDEEEAQPGWRVLQRTLGNDADLRSMYEGRPRSRRLSGHEAPAPSTPTKGALAGDASVLSTPATGAVNAEDEEKEREAKEKERWARLKRVKSMFDLKAGRKSGKSSSRPGTGHSTRATGGDATN